VLSINKIPTFAKFQRGGIAEDKQNFVLLLETLKAKFTKRGKLLTAAVGATANTVATSYDLKGMCNVLDFVSIMAYDMHLPDRTSVHAALKLEMRQGSVETIVTLKKSGMRIQFHYSLPLPFRSRLLTISKPTAAPLTKLFWASRPSGVRTLYSIPASMT
jgi:GH18 family chitinase